MVSESRLELAPGLTESLDSLADLKSMTETATCSRLRAFACVVVSGTSTHTRNSDIIHMGDLHRICVSVRDTTRKRCETFAAVVVTLYRLFRSLFGPMLLGVHGRKTEMADVADSAPSGTGGR